MRSSTLEHWQESRNNYLSIFSYVAINFNHSPAAHSHFPPSSQSKSGLSWIDKQLIQRQHGATQAGKVIKGLQLLRAKSFQVNVTWDFAFCHSEGLGHTAHLLPGGQGGSRRMDKDWWMDKTRNKNVFFCCCFCLFFLGFFDIEYCKLQLYLVKITV